MNFTLCLQWPNTTHVVSIHSITHSSPKPHSLFWVFRVFCFTKGTMQHTYYLSIMLPLDWWVTIWERKLPQHQRLKEIFFIFSPINLQTFKEASSKRICTAFILYNTLSTSSLISLRQRADHHLLLSSSIQDRKNPWGGRIEHHFLLLTEYKQLSDWHKTPSSDYIHALESSFSVTDKTITQFCRDMESWVASHYLAYF